MSAPTSSYTTSATITEQAETSTSSWSTVTCPECGQPAEIIDRFTLSSTSGPVLHLQIGCAARHHFTLPAEHTDLVASVPAHR